MCQWSYLHAGATSPVSVENYKRGKMQQLIKREPKLSRNTASIVRVHLTFAAIRDVKNPS